MSQPTHLPLARRKRVLDAARDLARSGQYPDHKSILMHLELMEGFAEAGDRLRDIRGQLDRLCALAQSGRSRLRSPVDSGGRTDARSVTRRASNSVPMLQSGTW